MVRLIVEQRLGPAFNSSSSHSIILTKNKLDSDEGHEFGWDFFTCSSREHKKGYLAVVLSEIILNTGDHRILNALPPEQQKREKHLQLERLKYLAPSVFTDEDIKMYQRYGFGYIDHESVGLINIPFPIYSDRNESPGFTDEWCAAFVNSNIAILGGNDNTDYSHPANHEAVSWPDRDLFLTGLGTGNYTVRRVQDCWELSDSTGSYFKINFNNLLK